MHSWHDAAEYCDRLIGSFAAVSGDEVRAILLAMSAVETDRSDALAGRGVALGCVVGIGGLALLDAVLVLLRVRLADAVTVRVWDEPVPYALTEAGRAAVVGGGRDGEDS